MADLAYFLSGILQGTLAQEELQRRLETQRQEADRQSLVLQMNLQELLHRQQIDAERLALAKAQEERERQMSEIQSESMRFALEKNRYVFEKEKEQERKYAPFEETLRVNELADKLALAYSSPEEASKVFNQTMEASGLAYRYTPQDFMKRKSFVAQKQSLQLQIMQNVKSTAPVQSEMEQFIRLGEANGIPAGEVKAMYLAQVDANKQQYQQALQRQKEETKEMAKLKGEAEKLEWLSGGKQVFTEQQAIATQFNIKQGLALRSAVGGGGGASAKPPTQGQIQAIGALQSLFSSPTRYASYTPITLETDLTKVAQGNILGNSIPTIISKANQIRSNVTKLGDPTLASFSSSVYLLSGFNMLGDMVNNFSYGAGKGAGLPQKMKANVLTNIYSHPAFLSALQDFVSAPRELLLQIRDEAFWNMAVPSPNNAMKPITLREYVKLVRREDIFNPKPQQTPAKVQSKQTQSKK